MGSKDAGIDFSNEDFDTATAIFDGGWVVSEKHNPGLNKAMEVNNRTFVFRLKGKDGGEGLFVFGVGGQRTIDAIKRLEKEAGLSVNWVLGNGGAHHMFLELWYRGFPHARVLVPAKRVPFTRNGLRLQEEFADRWELAHGPRPSQIVEEFGDQIDVVVFDQLTSYRDQTSAQVGAAADHRSEEQNVGGFAMLKVFGKLMKDTSQPNDELFLFHRGTGLVVAGHNFQFIYKPKGYKAPPKFKLRSGGFPLNIMMSMMMPKGAFKSSLEGQPAPILDPAAHAAAWDAVLDWPIKAWTSAHDPPTVCGPDLPGDRIKELIRESIHRSGEDDPTGKRLKWNLKHPA